MAKENKGTVVPFGQPADRKKAKRHTMLVATGGETVLGKYKNSNTNDKTKKQVNKNAN